MVTITAVAEAAGVSIATVSRVINQSSRVSADKVRAVQRAMVDLGYRPPARPLRGRGVRAVPGPSRPTVASQGSLALLIPDHRDVALRTALSARFIHGLNDVCQAQGLALQVTSLEPDGGLPPSIAKALVDGVAVRATVPVADLARRIPSHLPVVWLLETVEDSLFRGDQVLEDTAAIGRLAAQHLLDRGHRCVATINNDPAHPCYARRIAAFTAVIRAAGGEVIAFDGGRLLTTAELPALALRLLADPRQPTGLFLPLNDEGTAAIQRGFNEHGGLRQRRLDQVACGYDRGLMAALNPDLYNIDIQAEAMAQTAGEILLWRLTHPEAPRRRILMEPSIRHVGPA